MNIKRSDGVNPSEKYLQRLCEHSFLRLWSYPRIYRDQSSGNGNIVGKEICDLLVVFGNHILIFSDKYCEFPNTGDIKLDWTRWVKRSILKSSDQVFGAERWIKEFPERIFLDKECKQKFPLTLPENSKIKIHRIIVAHGAKERCQEFFGGSGSLMITTTLDKKIHQSKLEDSGHPFVVSINKPGENFVHILDDVTLDIILRNLDTITDFVLYLEKKEQFIKKLSYINIPGEEDLLALYLRNLNPDGEHDFPDIKDNNGFILEEGFWEEFLKSEQYKSKKEADRISYGWDRLINSFLTHFFNQTFEKVSWNDVNEFEEGLRWMVKEPRTRRRLIMNTIYKKIEKTSPTESSSAVICPSNPGDPYYIFVLSPYDEKSYSSYQEYKEIRGEFLMAYCLILKYKFPDVVDLIGIATESGLSDNRSEDLIYHNFEGWTEENQKEAEDLYIRTGLLKDLTIHQSKEYEFPIKVKNKRHRHKSKKK